MKNKIVIYIFVQSYLTTGIIKKMTMIYISNIYFKPEANNALYAFTFIQNISIIMLFIINILKSL